MLSMIILIPFIYYVQNKLNLLWGELRKLSIDENSGLMQMCIERLERVHDEIGILEINERISSKTKIMHFSYIRKYSSRLLIYAVIGSIFYVTMNFTYYQNFATLLSTRPKLFSHLIYSKINLSKLDFISKEVLGIALHNNLEVLYPDYISMSTDYVTDLNALIANIKSDSEAILSPDFHFLLGDALYYAFLENKSSNLTILRYGSISAMAAMSFESLYIGYFGSTKIVGIYMTFFQNIIDLGMYFEDVIQEAGNYSEKAIISFLQQYIVITICFCLLLLLLYAAFYYPFFSLEQRKIESMAEMSKVLVSNTSMKPEFAFK